MAACTPKSCDATSAILCQHFLPWSSIWSAALYWQKHKLTHTVPLDNTSHVSVLWGVCPKNNFVRSVCLCCAPNPCKEAPVLDAWKSSASILYVARTMRCYCFRKVTAFHRFFTARWQVKFANAFLFYKDIIKGTVNFFHCFDADHYYVYQWSASVAWSSDSQVLRTGPH